MQITLLSRSVAAGSLAATSGSGVNMKGEEGNGAAQAAVPSASERLVFVASALVGYKVDVQVSCDDLLRLAAPV